MLDPALLRNRLDDVRNRLATRGNGFGGDLDRLVALDAERRAILPVLESARHARKDVGERIARARRTGEPVETLVQAGQEHAAAIKEQEARLESVEAERGAWALKLPNLPHASVPVGRSEGRQRRGPAARRAPPLRLRAAAALGARPGAGHPRFRARREARRGRGSPCSPALAPGWRAP